MALASCASIPAVPPLTQGEISVACELSVGLDGLKIKQLAGSQTPEETAKVSGLYDQLDWKELPRKLRCRRGTVRLSRLNEEGYGQFFESVGIAKDGQLAAISGGYQVGPLLGGGAVCYFKRQEAGWRRLGCAETWAS
jgi:hypothetical protein